MLTQNATKFDPIGKRFITFIGLNPLILDLYTIRRLDKMGQKSILLDKMGLEEMASLHSFQPCLISLLQLKHKS